MKKHALLLIILLAVMYKAEAQVNFGAKVNGNVNQFNEPGTVMAGGVGGFARFTLQNFLQVESALMYNVAGGGRQEYNIDFKDVPGPTSPQSDDIDGPIDNVRILSRKAYLHNVEIPVIFRFNFAGNNSQSISPQFIIGGSYAYTAAAHEYNDKLYQFENDQRVLLSDRFDNVTSAYTRHQANVLAGFALDFTLDNGKTVTTGCHYKMGLIDQNKKQNTYPILIEDLTPSSINFEFSYTLN